MFRCELLFASRLVPRSLHRRRLIYTASAQTGLSSFALRSVRREESTLIVVKFLLVKRGHERHYAMERICAKHISAHRSRASRRTVKKSWLIRKPWIDKLKWKHPKTKNVVYNFTLLDCVWKNTFVCFTDSPKIAKSILTLQDLLASVRLDIVSIVRKNCRPGFHFYLTVIFFLSTSFLNEKAMRLRKTHSWRQRFTNAGKLPSNDARMSNFKYPVR